VKHVEKTKEGIKVISQKGTTLEVSKITAIFLGASVSR
jgi:hypothetical protein